MDVLRELRWQQRTLPDSVKENLSPAEQQVIFSYMLIVSAKAEH